MLSRLWTYSNKIFELDSLLAALPDNSSAFQYNQSLITTILLKGMLLRMPSIHALGLSIKNNPISWHKLTGADDLPSISTLSRRLEELDIKALRQISWSIIHQLRRNKVFSVQSPSGGLMVAAVDGHETISSVKRCCPTCSERKKTVGGREVTEYFHRYVVCQLVAAPVPAIIDIESINPKEGEVAAARRLIDRVLRKNKRLVDVFVFDALYLQATLMNMIDESGKFWITVLKQEQREAYREIDRLFPQAKKQVLYTTDGEVILCDLPELVGWDSLKTSFRAVVSEEKKMVWQRDEKGRRRKVQKVSHWRWLTNMPSVYEAKVVHRLGHARWDIENRGFNELVNHCNFDHAFHHHPEALLAMLWLIALAFVLSYTFFLRNLKPQRQKLIQTRQQLVEQMRLSLVINDSPGLSP